MVLRRLDPVFLVERASRTNGESFCLTRARRVAARCRHLAHRVDGENPHGREVDVLVDALADLADLDGTEAARRVLDDAVAVRVVFEAPRPRLLQCRPQLGDQRIVARGAPVLPCGGDPVRRRVGVVVGVGKIAEPRHLARRLRDLVRDLAVGTLVLGEEPESLGHEAMHARRRHRQRVDRRVAAEEPPESWAQALPRRRPSRHRTTPEVGVAHALLVEVHLGPLERQVEAVVGRIDRHGRIAQAGGMLDALPVERRGVGDEPLVRREELVTFHRAGNNGDGNELTLRAFGVNGNAEHARSIRKRMRGMVRRRRRPRRTEIAVPLAQALGEHEGLPLGVPRGVLPAKRAWPGVLEHVPEARDDLERMNAVDVEQHEQPGLIEWCEDVLADGERGVRVRDRRQLGPDIDATRHVGAAHRVGVVGDPEVEPEAADQLERVHPQLGLSRFRTQPGRPRADNAEILLRTHIAAQPDRRCLDGELRDRRERRWRRPRLASNRLARFE